MNFSHHAKLTIADRHCMSSTTIRETFLFTNLVRCSCLPLCGRHHLHGINIGLTHGLSPAVLIRFLWTWTFTTLPEVVLTDQTNKACPRTISFNFFFILNPICKRLLLEKERYLLPKDFIFPGRILNFLSYLENFHETTLIRKGSFHFKESFLRDINNLFGGMCKGQGRYQCELMTCLDLLLLNLIISRRNLSIWKDKQTDKTPPTRLVHINGTQNFIVPVLMYLSFAPYWD